MKFVSSSGQAIAARHAWHEAFNSNITSIDMREVANHFGVQFSCKGGDNNIMDHCDKGKIQQIINTVRNQNQNAWAWGMFAYSPEQFGNTSSIRNILFRFAMDAVTHSKFNAFQSHPCGKLAFLAMQDASIESRTGARRKRKRVDVANLLGIDEETYKREWMSRFVKMKDVLKDLDAIALPPVSSVVWMLIDKAQGSDSESAIASDDLRRALITPESLA